MSTKSNFGYLTYQKMLDYIEQGKIDSYDMVFCYDTREWYVVSPDNKPFSVRSRIYVFSSTDEANEKLNSQTDTYEGQIVAVKTMDSVAAYIVAKNSDEKFYIAALASYDGCVDYNSLGNRPIINLIGTISNPVNIADLDTGIYDIKGQYTVDSNIESTIYLSANSNLFMVTREDSLVNIKHITSKEVTDYTITESSIEKTKTVTDKFLDNCGFVTEDYVDKKIIALQASIEQDVRRYMDEYAIQLIEELVTQTIDASIDDKIDKKINDKITPVTSDAIHELFKSSDV